LHGKPETGRKHGKHGLQQNKSPDEFWRGIEAKGLKDLGKLSPSLYQNGGKSQMEQITLNISKKIRELEIKQRYGFLTADEEAFLRQLRRMEVRQDG